MTLITRSALASPDASTAMYAPQITGLIAGAAIDNLSPCYIKASDGKVYMSNATAANEAAKVNGFSMRAAAEGEAVSLYGFGTRMRYSTSLTPGAILYVGATAGRLDDGATVGDWQGVAVCIDDTDIQIIRSTPLVRGNYAGSGLAFFVSAEQTGTGSAQNVAHGLGVAPSKVVVVPTDLSPSVIGDYTATEGTHTTTNAVVTVTSGKKFKVIAFA